MNSTTILRAYAQTMERYVSASVGCVRAMTEGDAAAYAYASTERARRARAARRFYRALELVCVREGAGRRRARVRVSAAAQRRTERAAAQRTRAQALFTLLQSGLTLEGAGQCWEPPISGERVRQIILRELGLRPRDARPPKPPKPPRAVCVVCGHVSRMPRMPRSLLGDYYCLRQECRRAYNRALYAASQQRRDQATRHTTRWKWRRLHPGQPMPQELDAAAPRTVLCDLCGEALKRRCWAVKPGPHRHAHCPPGAQLAKLFGVINEQIMIPRVKEA